jgi:hypothetical protein
MFELIRSRRLRKRVTKQFPHLSRTGTVLTTKDLKRDEEIKALEKQIDMLLTRSMLKNLYMYDLDLPQEPEFFVSDDSMRLTTMGRMAIRKLIEDEKARRFEIRTRWVTKLILPLLAAIIGIIGALTGLVAVLQHKK